MNEAQRDTVSVSDSRLCETAERCSQAEPHSAHHSGSGDHSNSAHTDGRISTGLHLQEKQEGHECIA